MAYSGDQEKKALERKQALAVVKQTAPGVLGIPVATDTVLVKTFSANQDPEYHEDDQARDTRDQLEGLVGILPHGDISITCKMKPSGTAGTQPEIAELLEGLTGSQVAMAADTVAATPAPTVDGCTVTDGTRFAVGQCRYVQLATGPKLVSILTVAANAITWEPSLPSAPAAGAAIYAGIWWKEATDLSLLSVWRKIDDRVYSYEDVMIGKGSGPVDGKSVLEMTFAGGFVKYYLAGSDEVGTGGIDGASQTLPVKDPLKFIPGAGCYIKVQDEIMKATARNATTLTVDRAQMSTAAVPHVVDTPITPWFPTVTEVGSRIHGKFGLPRWKLGSTWEDLPTEEFSWDLDNGLEWSDGTKKDDGTSSGADAHERKVAATLKFLYRRKYSKLHAMATNEVVAKIIMPVGNVVGKTFVFVAPQAKFPNPKIEGKVQMVDLALKLYASGSYNDSINIFEL